MFKGFSNHNLVRKYNGQVQCHWEEKTLTQNGCLHQVRVDSTIRKPQLKPPFIWYTSQNQHDRRLKVSVKSRKYPSCQTFKTYFRVNTEWQDMTRVENCIFPRISQLSWFCSILAQTRPQAKSTYTKLRISGQHLFELKKQELTGTCEFGCCQSTTRMLEPKMNQKQWLFHQCACNCLP